MIASPTAGPENRDRMAPLTVPWVDCDAALWGVTTGGEACDPAWAELASVLNSYPLWTAGDRPAARIAAAAADGPLARALERWYDHLERASTSTPARCNRDATVMGVGRGKSPVVLGLCAFTHDPSAALVVDGELVGLVEEERLSGIKHTKQYPRLAVDWLLARAGITERLQHGSRTAPAWSWPRQMNRAAGLGGHPPHPHKPIPRLRRLPAQLGATRSMTPDDI